MRSAWNDCALDAPNFLQIGGMGLRIVFSGLGEKWGEVGLRGDGGRSFLCGLGRGWRRLGRLPVPIWMQAGKAIALPLSVRLRRYTCIAVARVRRPPCWMVADYETLRMCGSSHPSPTSHHSLRLSK